MRALTPDLSVWSQARIEREMRSAAKAVRGLSRKDLESQYVAQLGALHAALNERNRALRRPARRTR